MLAPALAVRTALGVDLGVDGRTRAAAMTGSKTSTDLGGRRLRRADRVRSPRDHARLQRVGRRRVAPHFVAVLGPGWTERTRLGLAVGRRVGGAVQRNRVKRQVREWFRRSRCALPERTDLVIIARQGAAELRGEEIARELGKLFAC